MKMIRLWGPLFLWVLLTLALAWPMLSGRLDNTPQSRPPRIGGTNYLIVAPEGLQASAQAWAAYRGERGYATQVMLLPPETATVENVRTAVQSVYAESGRPYPFSVLLLGQAHPGSSGAGNYLPAATVKLDLAPELLAELGYDAVASDDAYALQDGGSELLPIAFGRVPARNDEEALRVLARTQAFESHPPAGLSRTQIELVASESEFGPAFDQLIEFLVTYLVEHYLPPYYRWHMLYGHPGSPYSYPVDDFPNEVARRLDQGALLVTYIGHGSSRSLGPTLSADGQAGRVFASPDLPLVTQAGDSVVTMIACSAGEYDVPGAPPSLAEALLLQPGGAVATYAASRLTIPAANTILGKDLFQILLTGRAPTAGEWVRLAESNFKNPGSDQALSIWLLSRAVPPLYNLAIQRGSEKPAIEADTLYTLQQHAYNLFGDPALALAQARTDLHVRPRFLWQPMGNRLSFTGEGHDLQPGQIVTVTLYTLQGTLLPPDKPLESLRASYLHANDKTVTQVSVTAGEGGQFAGELPLPTGLPAGHYILEAVAANDQVTWVGSQSVYRGWPPAGEMLLSTTFWWLVVSAGLVWQIVRRGVRSHAPSRNGL